MRLVTPVLLTLLVIVHAELWLGKHGVPHVMRLQSVVREQAQKNRLTAAQNAQLEAEVSDLREGLETVEEKARYELGMVKNHEIFVSYKRPTAAAASPASAPSP